MTKKKPTQVEINKHQFTFEFFTNEEGLKQFNDAMKKELEDMVKPKSNKEYSDKMKKYLKERGKK